MSVVVVQGLCKSFGNKQILKDVNITIQESEIVGFIGPNGAGKSTTMKCIASLIAPDKGSVMICGHDLLKEREKALNEMSAMIENPGLFPTLTGYENIVYFAKLRNVSKSRVDEIIAFTRLGDHIKKKTAHYSMGMKQRLGLGIALLNEPKFLILDEPTNGLDPNGIMELRKELRGLAQQQGVSILISSHQLDEIDKIADRIICINKGEIIDTPKKLHESYTYTFLMDEENLEKAKRLSINNVRLEWTSNGVHAYFPSSTGMRHYLRLLMEAHIQVDDIIKETMDIEEIYKEIYQEDL